MQKKNNAKTGDMYSIHNLFNMQISTLAKSAEIF